MKIPYDEFSIKKVAELAGIKIQLYITKPTVGKDFNEMLQSFQKDIGEKKMNELFRKKIKCKLFVNFK